MFSIWRFTAKLIVWLQNESFWIHNLDETVFHRHCEFKYWPWELSGLNGLSLPSTIWLWPLDTIRTILTLIIRSFPLYHSISKLEKFLRDWDNFHKIWILIFKFRKFKCLALNSVRFYCDNFNVSILNFKWFEFWELRFINRSANIAPLNALPNS